VAVAAQGCPQARPHRGKRRGEQTVQVRGLLAAGGLLDDLGGGRADPRKGAQRALADPQFELPWWQLADDLGGPAERPDAVGRRAGPLELERYLPQCLCRVHVSCLTRTSGMRVLCAATCGRRVLCAATCDRLRIMRRAEGTFNPDRFDDEAPYDNREGVKLALAHIRKTFIIPDGGQSCALDYEL
jgi:hypothetical protein